MILNLKIAIIGFGKIGKIYKQILESLGYEIIICDTASTLYIQDYREDSLKTCDLIIITTPPALHFEIAEYFLLLGKKVLIEKPPVINRKQIKILKELDKGSLLYCAYHTVFNPLFGEINNLINTDELESIEIINREYIYNYHKKDGWITNSNISGGGCLIDNGINSFSVIMNYVDSIKFVSGNLETRYLNVEDYVDLKLEAKNNKGTIVNIKYNSDWFCKINEERKYIFNSKNDCLELNISQNKVLLNGIEVKNKFDNINSVQEMQEYRKLINDMFKYFDTQTSYLKYRKFEPLELVLNCYNNIFKND